MGSAEEYQQSDKTYLWFKVYAFPLGISISQIRLNFLSRGFSPTLISNLKSRFGWDLSRALKINFAGRISPKKDC